MKRTFMIALLLFVLSAGGTKAGEIKEIELKDGSIITGEVRSLENGMYTIRTESLGTVKIEDSRVLAIRPRGQGAPSRPSDAGSQARSLEERMQADDQVMNKIRSLKDDPAFQKVLEDPELMNAVNTGDVAALMADPRFLQLLQNPAVKDIQKKMEK
jgi:hypothetical protein